VTRRPGEITNRYRAGGVSKLVQLAILMAAAAVAPPAGASKQPTLLVFPLEDRTGVPAFSWMGEGIALSVADAILDAGMTAVSRDERVRLVEQADLPPGLPLSRASMIRVAQQGSIDFVVFGTYSGNEKDLHLSLRAFDLHRLGLGGEVAAHGPAAALPEAENELAWNLLATAGLCEKCSREGFRSSTRRIPNNAYAAFIQGLLAPDEDEQVRWMQKAVGLYRGFPQAQYRLGKHFAGAGDCPAAIRHLETVRGDRTLPLDSLIILGTCQLNEAKLDPAVQSLTAYLSFRRDAVALNNAGVAYLRKGDHALAAEYLASARAEAPSNAAILTNMAVLRFVQGNPPALVSLIRESGEAARASGLLQFLLGEGLERMGDGPGAVEAWKRARLLGVDPAAARAVAPGTWTIVLAPPVSE
jgi:hypothetical protein